jgi:hypothetical protein
LAVHFYGEANNLFAQQIIFVRRCHSIRLSPPHRLIVQIKKERLPVRHPESGVRRK